MLDRAHYAGAAQFTVDYEGELDWKARWRAYLDAYITACGVGDDPSVREEVHLHLDSEFATGAAVVAHHSRIGRRSPHARRDRRARRHRVERRRLGRANASPRKRCCRSGPGIGVEVECVIDSGAVGVSKPDPRIFQIALDAIGVAAADAWYVGDMPGIDVVGARAAGLLADRDGSVRLPTTAPTTPA